jgi:hypothetical protein
MAAPLVLGPVLAALATWFATALPGLIFRTLALLGVGIVTYTGFSALSTQLGGFFTSQLGAFPSSMLSIMNLAGFDTGLNMLLAGVATFFTIKATMGAFKRLRIL